MRLIMVWLFSFLMFVGCAGGNDPAPQVKEFITDYSIDSIYHFSVGDGSFDIGFQAEGLKEGDKVRLTSNAGQFEYYIRIDAGGSGSISLPGDFQSGYYFFYFIRGRQSQQARYLLIDISDPSLRRNRVVAHRQGASEAGLPDNSLAALRYAVGLGCYAAECDIYVTKDDSVVVCHTEDAADAVFAGRVIYNSTYTELKDAKKLANGESLPLLQDFLAELAKSKEVKLWLDVKSIGENTETNKILSARAGIRAVEIVRRMKMEERVEYIVGRKLTLDLLREKVPVGAQVGYMNEDFTPAQFIASGYDWANFAIAGFVNNPSGIKSYQNVGIKFSVWNADSYSEMDFFIRQNIYAICTNYPKMLLDMVDK